MTTLAVADGAGNRRPPRASRRWWVTALWILGIVAFLGLLARGCARAPSGPAEQRARIALLPDTAPPPLPPKKPEQKPPPEKQERAVEPVVLPTPEPPALKMDAAPTEQAGSLVGGPVTIEYSGGPTGAGSDSRMSWNLFSSRLQRELQERLALDEALRRSPYRATVRLWLTPSGAIERVELPVGSGSGAAVDEEQALRGKLREALTRLGEVTEPPPPGMPQPILLRIVNLTVE